MKHWSGGSAACAVMAWMLMSPSVGMTQDSSTYDSVGNAMSQAAKDFKEASRQEEIELALEVAASSLAVAPAYLHFDALVCAPWLTITDNIIKEYMSRVLKGDAGAWSVVDKAYKLKEKLAAVCDPHEAGKPEPDPKPPIVNPPPPPPDPTPAEKQAQEVDKYCALRCKPAYDAWKAREAEREALDKQLIPLIMQAAAQGKKYEMDPSDKQTYDHAAALEKAAKAEYDACVHKCYEQAVGAGLISTIPDMFSNGSPRPGPQKESSLAPPAKTPTLGDGSFKSIQPGPLDATGKSQVAFLPPIAGKGSSILAMVTDPNEGGPYGVVVGTVDENGKRKFFKGVTDEAGYLALLLPVGITALDILKVDQNGTPTSMAHTNVETAVHVPNTEPIPTGQVPSHGPAITEASPVVEQGGANQGTVVLHTHRPRTR
jgi:hypothetical protein